MFSRDKLLIFLALCYLHVVRFLLIFLVYSSTAIYSICLISCSWLLNENVSFIDKKRFFYFNGRYGKGQIFLVRGFHFLFIFKLIVLCSIFNIIRKCNWRFFELPLLLYDTIQSDSSNGALFSTRIGPSQNNVTVIFMTRTNYNTSRLFQKANSVIRNYKTMVRRVNGEWTLMYL